MGVSKESECGQWGRMGRDGVEGDIGCNIVQYVSAF